MDHKGPEHHYDELESPENGRSIFWQQGEVAPDHVEAEGDFHGEGRPYRSQPNPVEDDMDRYRDMPLDGASNDEGGNQFRTDKGILASKNDEEESLEQFDEATEPKGLGETHPVKDNNWPSGEITTRPARDEMLGSVRHSDDEGEDKLWDEVVEDFEHAEGGEVEDTTDKVAAASWLENDGQDSNIPVEHLGWDVVDVVEPSREYIEATNKYTMPMPQGITDAVHEALIQTNAWVENPEENGKLRPYKQYWSAIKPKIVEGNVQIAVEDPHMADIINHVVRTDDPSVLNKTSSFYKEAWGLALRAVPMAARALGVGAAEGGAAGGVMGKALNMGKNMAMMHGISDMVGGAADTAGSMLGMGGGGAQQQMQAPMSGPESFGVIAKTAGWVTRYDQQGNPLYWDQETGQWITSAQLQSAWEQQGGQGPMPKEFTYQYLQYMSQEQQAEEWQKVQEQIQQGGQSSRAITRPTWKGYEPEGRRELGLGGFLPGHNKLQIADPNNPGQAIDPSLIPTKDNSPEFATLEDIEGTDQSALYRAWDPSTGQFIDYYPDFERPEFTPPSPPSTEDQPNDPLTEESLPEEDNQNKKVPGGENELDPLNLYQMGYITYQTLKNILNSPNKEMQTRGIPGEARGGESFGVISKAATYGDDFDHPSSITRRVEDLENGGIDPHQRTDESNDEWGYDMLDVNEIGQSRDIRGDDYEKHNLKRLMASDDKKQKAIDKFFDTLPLIMEFFHSEESGLDDPIVKSVHEDLENAFPGYLDLALPDEENPILIMLNESDNQKEAAAPAMQAGPQPQQAIPSMGTNGVCPKCGNDMGPDLTCQQCTPDSARAFMPAQRSNITHTPELNITGRIASDTQGPHTDEQQAAVAEMLIEQDREDEIPNMLQNPADYDEELAEAQNKDPLLGEDPEDVGMGAQDQMAQMGMGPDAGGMPAGPPMGGEMPPGPPGAAPGIPDMSAPTPADLNPAGPGAMPPPVMASITSSMLEAAFKHGADNVAGKCPKCDSHTTKMVQQDGKAKCHTCGHEWQDKTFQKSDGDSSHSTTTSSFYAAMDSFVDDQVEEEIIDDSSHTWTDESGEPLEEGKEYEIYAHNYEIPDVGRVVELKPDAIVYEIESDGGLRTTIEIDRQEADLNGYRFAPTVSDSDESLDDGTFGIEDKIAPEPGQATDLSTPHREIGASAKESTVTYYMCPVADCPNNQGGGDYEPGTCSIHNKELVPAGQEKSAHKTAGKHYTPMEQRELIDEYGQARNADKLNLEGTHYAEADDDYFLFGC